MTIGGILVGRELFGNGAPFSSGSDSLSERTANWFGDRKEVVASLGVIGRLRFLFSRWVVWKSWEVLLGSVMIVIKFYATGYAEKTRLHS